MSMGKETLIEPNIDCYWLLVIIDRHVYNKKISRAKRNSKHLKCRKIPGAKIYAERDKEIEESTVQ